MSGRWPIPGSERRALPGARILKRTNPRLKIEVLLKLRRARRLPELNHRPPTIMTRKQLASRFGASKADIAAVIRAFDKLKIATASSDRATRTVRLRGTVGQMEKAFATRLFDYAHEDGDYRGRVGPVHVPDEIKHVVEAVFGLDSRIVARRRRLSAHAGSRVTAAMMTAAWYTSKRLAAHYSFPDGDGAGQTIGLLEFGGGYFSSDLRQYCKLAGIDMPRVTTVSVGGTSTSRRDGTQGEVMLDVEVVAGVCPKAAIAIYFAPWTEEGWIAGLDAILQDEKNDPGVVSVSWGNAEDTDIWTDQAIAQINEMLKEAAYRGITVCVAAGDDGSSDGVDDGLAHVDFPGSSPYALSVGGTTIRSADGNNLEMVWKDGEGLRSRHGGSTGGGVSGVFARPAWQKDVKIKSVNRGAIIGRCVPDVAANADWNSSPYLLVVDRKPQPNGGTSAASPLWAALVTLINAKRRAASWVGYLTPLLYQRAGRKDRETIGALGCNDISSGDNATAMAGGYRAGRGYDAASGWGTPNGLKLLSLLPP